MWEEEDEKIINEDLANILGTILLILSGFGLCFAIVYGMYMVY